MTTTQAKPADLPRIVQFLGTTDGGEDSDTRCPHCDARGRFVHSFLCDDGTRRAAMSGCIKLFRVSRVADEHKKIVERAKDRAKKEQKLAGWDLKKLEAIEAYYAGTKTEGQVLDVIRFENARRNEWMQRKGYRR